MLNELRKKDVRLSPRAAEIFRRMLAGVILSLFIGAAAAVYWNLLPERKDFYNELWAPAFLLVHGQSPYDTSSLDPVLPAAWLPMSIGFFFPLGWLKEADALSFWFLFSLVELALIVLLIRRENNSTLDLIVVSAFAFGFPPTLYHLLLGQFSLTTALCAAAGVHSILKERHWLGAFLLALGLSKAHLMTLPMLGLSMYYFQRAGFKGMIMFWGRIVFAALVLCLPLFIAYPNWIPDAIESMASNAPWAFPTLQKYLVFTFGSWGLALWGVSVILVVFLSLFIWKRLDPAAASFWNLGLALLISPYIGSWDFVVLLPLLIHAFLSAGKWQKGFAIASYLAAWYLMARIQGLEESHNYYFWWVPLWFLATAAVITKWFPTHDPRARS